MASIVPSGLTLLAGFGVVAGLVLLARGLAGYRSMLQVGDVSTSDIASVAAGEIRLAGIVEPAEMTLISLLQSVPCVYYRASVGRASNGRTTNPGYTEERAIGFRIRDASGSLRVFPRGARFDAALRFQGETDMTGAEPVGLDIRRGASTQSAEIDRAVAVAALLETHQPASTSTLGGIGDRHGARRYRELRLEPGDQVTIIGRALPFSDLDDPDGADVGLGGDVGLDDPEVMADLAEARAEGHLAADPAAAWGNAAIPGFGIGHPVAAPTLDPAADPLPLAGPDAVARISRTFDIAPEALVVAASPDVPLLIAYGVPDAVVERGQTRFTLGLLGAVLAIVSAMVVAIDLSGGFGR